MFGNITNVISSIIGRVNPNSENTRMEIANYGQHTVVMPSITTSNDAIIYCRVSSAKQSMNAQIDVCRTYCDSKGYNVIDVVTETSTAFQDHCQPKLLNLISSITNTNLIIYNIDRFSRNVNNCDKMIRTLLDNQINIDCVLNPINISSALGRRNLRHAVLDSQYESELNSERTKKNHSYRKKNGIKTRSTYGFDLSEDRKSLVHNLEERAVINFITQNMNKQLNSQQITDLLFALMRTLKKPDTDFVEVMITEDYNNDSKVKITATTISGLFDDYNIKKRGKKWSSAMVRAIRKNAMNIDNLNIGGLKI